jgi:hypothetical protein
MPLPMEAVASSALCPTFVATLPTGRGVLDLVHHRGGFLLDALGGLADCFLAALDMVLDLVLFCR